ncbi:hypothetical protein [Furfurilactobacillus rossiae]|nr:hypothetical protein [Furfurilactobacillus rossiae]QFR66419.1 hypothetical protein LR814_04630 [Furfurilactobacillus rossiae]
MMPLFGKSDDKPKLIETVGPVPEGYHSDGIIQTSVSGQDEISSQSKTLKNLANICKAANASGFANYRLSTHFNSGVKEDVIFAYADIIRAN